MHTDPSLDFFEVQYPVKYKLKYSHFLNQRVFYEPVEAAQDEAPDPNAALFEERTAEGEEEEKKGGPQFKKVVLTYQEVKQSQARLRSYPPVLLHTLFHDDPKYDQYRQRNLSQLFFFGDEVKSLGNDFYHKGDYYTALDYYEQCITLYSWLELRDPKTLQRHRFTGTKEEKAKVLRQVRGVPQEVLDQSGGPP